MRTKKEIQSRLREVNNEIKFNQELYNNCADRTTKQLYLAQKLILGARRKELKWVLKQKS